MSWMTPTEQLILIILLAALMLVIVFFELRVMRGKSKELRKSSQKKDEAFNSILTTRHVINVVQRSGKDTRTAQALLDEAKYALQKNDYDKAMDLAEKSRKELTHPGHSDQDVSGPASDLEKVAEEVLATPKGDSNLYTGTKLPVDQTGGSYLSAQFELNGAREDVRRASGTGRDVNAASKMIAEAETAFQQGNYTKVLSLAVRARKAIGMGGAIETIPLRAEPEEIEEEGEEPPPRSVGSPGKINSCGQCGNPIEAGDAFCAGCGARAITDKTCENCGAKARQNDKFCRKCGGKID